MTKTLYKMDIQLFAYDPQAQPVNNTGSDTLTAENKTFYEKVLIREAQPNLVHMQFGQKKPIPRRNGKTVEFRKYNSLGKALTPLVEGVTPDGRKLSVETITAVVKQYGDFVPLTDMLELTAIDDNIIEAEEALGNEAGLTLDTIVRNVMHSGTNVYFAPTISGGTKTEVTHRYDLDASAVLTVDTVRKVVAKLKSQNAPKNNGYYIGIIHPFATYDLQSDPEWQDASKYGNPEQLFNGEIGKIGGVRFVETSEAKIYAAADLTKDARELTVASASAEVITVNETLEADALVDREVIIDGEHFEIVANTANTITLDIAPSSAPSASTKIFPGEAGKDGVAVFGTLILGKDAYGTTQIEGGGLQTFVEQLGSGGTSDPLHQRSTVGWKATLTAEILHENYMVRIEHGSSYSATDLEGN